MNSENVSRRGVWPYAPGATKTIWFALVVAVGLLLALAVGHTRPAAAQQGEFPLPPGITWDDVNKVASKMYCDVCEGIPLDECESVACRQWRQEIAQQLSEGRNEDQIIDFFVQRYGDDVSAIPRNKSDKFLVFAVPVSLALLLLLFGAMEVNHLRKRGQQAGQTVRRSASISITRRPVPDDIEQDYLDRLEKELSES